MRFSMKTLLITVTVAAAICCVFFSLPGIIAVPLIGMGWLFVPPALVASIVYCRGYARAFAIGCVCAGGGFPILWFYAMTLLLSGLEGVDSIELDNDAAVGIKFGFGLMTAFIAMSGLTSMAVRWLALRGAPTVVDTGAIGKEPRTPHYEVLRGRVAVVPVDDEATEVERREDGHDDR